LLTGLLDYKVCTTYNSFKFLQYYPKFDKNIRDLLKWIFNDEALTGSDVLLEQSEEEDGEGGEGDVVEGKVDPVVQGL
jgi:hypothetical protein